MSGSSSTNSMNNNQGENTNKNNNENINLQIRAKDEVIEQDINTNLNKIKEIFCYPINQDFVIREIHIKAINRRGVLLFLQGMTDINSIEKQIITPLMHGSTNIPIQTDVLSLLKKRILTGKGVVEQNNLKQLVNSIVNGNSILLVEGINFALTLSTVGYEHRSIEKPVSENTLKGPKEAFIESEQTNRSLIRKYVRDEKLITETIELAGNGGSRAFIMYIADIANQDLVKNIKNRLRKIKADKVEAVSIIEQYIEDRPYSLVPTTLSTERPDRAAAFLLEGHVVILLDGSPSALIVPITFWSLFQNPEDMYQRWAFGNFVRIIRLICCFIALLTPGLYIAVTSYHIDMIPTDLVLAIAGSRERLPFPAFMEVLLMEIAFEILREAGVRIPTPIGPTIGIVGALILGQAAVEANVVSPILVIVVAVTGLASFAIPEISLSFLIRISRFLFLFAGALLGFFGIATLFTISLAYMSTVKSFGVYFMSPFAPNYRSSKDFIVRPPVWKLWLRPQNLHPQRDVRKKKPQGS